MLHVHVIRSEFVRSKCNWDRRQQQQIYILTNEANVDGAHEGEQLGHGDGKVEGTAPGVGTLVGFPTTGMGALVDGNDDGIEDGDGDAMGNKEGVIVGGGVVGCDVVVGIIVGCPDVGIEDSALVG